MKRLLLSLVLPAHNEAERLPTAVKEAEKALRGISHEIIIAEDGSSDDSAKIAALLEEKYPSVRAFCYTKRLGRGRALAYAFKEARGTYVGYMDVDLATDPSAIKDALSALEKNDVVIGSRCLLQSKASRAADRRVLSSGYNLLVRALLGSRLFDHQCGFKFFRKKAALKLCRQAQDNHWFWDTEVLVLAQADGMRVVEIPVQWTEKKENSKVEPLNDALSMGEKVVRMAWRRQVAKKS